MSIELVMPSSHLILCHPFLFLPPIPPSIRVFSSESTLHIKWPKYWSFSFSISPRETWVQFLGWEDPLRRERLPSPVFWPEEFHGLYSPWSHKELEKVVKRVVSPKYSPQKKAFFPFHHIHIRWILAEPTVVHHVCKLNHRILCLKFMQWCMPTFLKLKLEKLLSYW